MKRFALFIAHLLLSGSLLPALAQQKETEVLAPVTAIKLHITGASVEHTTSVMLKPGRNHFVFPELSSKLYPQTIQFDMGDPSIKVLSVTSKTNFLRKRLEDTRILSLQDSVEIVRAKINELQDEKAAYVEETALLQANRNIRGSDKTLTAAELKSLADFYRARTLEIQKALTRINEAELITNRRLFDLKLQLHEWNAGQQPTSEISLVVDSKAAARADISFRYVVSDAGWAAIYDLESNNGAELIELRYRAQAYNNTGVDWNNVKLTLSTADPLETAVQPSLKVWSLDNYSSSQIHTISLDNNNLNINFDLSQNNYQKFNGGYVDMENDRGKQTDEVRQVLGADWNAGVDYETNLYRKYREEKFNESPLVAATIDVPEFNIDFPIAEPFSIPSDKKPYSVDISTHNLKVAYKYFAVPKMDKEAFLLAQVGGWEDLDLVGGPVNIFNGDKFIGQSNLNIRNISDTLAVSMGRDKDVVVTRLKVAGKSRRQILGGMNKVSAAYNITTRNNHSYPITMEIQDQVPITSDKEVQITVDELGGAEYDPKIGLLKWQFNLQPGETKTFEFGFSVKFPEGKTVQIQYKESRQMQQMRSF